MLELHALPVNVVACFARAEVLDRLSDGGEDCLRVAPDELLLFGARERLADVEEKLNILDHAGVALDLSSAFAIWALCGNDRLEAFCRLSELKLPDPPGVVQGLVAHVPAKVIVRPDEIVMIVSSTVSHHIRERVLTACADLAPSERNRQDVLVRERVPA